MDAPWIVLAAIVAVGLVYVLFPTVLVDFLRFRPKRQLWCPETGTNAEVRVDARLAAVTAPFRRPLLRVRSCSLWPERNGCEQTCLGLVEEGKPELLQH
jgi:hypothetical protein